MRLFNPADVFSAFPASPAEPKGGEPFTVSNEVQLRQSPIRATHGTVRAQRLIRKIAVQLFGRGKTRLEYRHAHWFVHVVNEYGEIEASFVAIDKMPGMFDTGIDLIPAP